MEGIILKKVLFGEDDAILTLFTDESGLVSVMKKKEFKKKRNSSATTSVLSRVECHLRRGRGELYHFQDVSLLDSYLDIRSDYNRLNVAGKILKILVKTQMKEKEASTIFHLTKVYLQALKSSNNTDGLLVSFYLKILRYEGLFSLEDFPYLDIQKKEDLIILAGSRQFESIASITVDAKIIEGVESLLTLYFS